MSGTRVIVLGGGVAGMSAAHELIERGFAVHVYESRDRPGGKARTICAPGTGRDGRPDLPGEHGFRFFPRFYRHLPDTMKRIPYPGNKHGVYDNLVETSRVLLAAYRGQPVTMIDRSPRSLGDLRTLHSGLLSHLAARPDFNRDDLSFFAERVWQLLTSCEYRRRHDYERISWWDFLEAPTRSLAYRKYLANVWTRSMVAVVPQKASAYVAGDMCLQALLNFTEPGIAADRVLNGPTDDVWIKPWHEYLTRKGVVFHFEQEVVSLRCQKLKGVTTVAGARLRSTHPGDPTGTTEVRGDYYILAVPVDVAGRLFQPDNVRLNAVDPALGRIASLRHDLGTMTGIQFYLRRPLPLVPGHVIYPDTPWALTSVSHGQFWPHFDLSCYGDGTVRDILSVDICDWDAPGTGNGKPARHCTVEEVKTEVWTQLKHSLNRAGATVLSDADRVDTFLDPDMHCTVGADGVVNWQNADSMFIARTNRWHLRPYSYTGIPNLFLAADYVRTHTKAATMEGANEAARLAVNGIIRRTGKRIPRCQIWLLREPSLFLPWRWNDWRRLQQGLPWKGRIPWIIWAGVRVLVWLLDKLPAVPGHQAIPRPGSVRPEEESHEEAEPRHYPGWGRGGHERRA